MSTWAGNTYNWNTIPYAWDDRFADPANATLALSGQLPISSQGNIAYPANATLTFNGLTPAVDLTFAPSPGVGTLTVNGQVPIFAKGVFRTVPQGTLTFDIPKWSDISSTWTTVSGTWSSYGMAPVVGQTHSYDPETGIFTIEGYQSEVVWKDPTWKPTVWII